MRDVSVTVERGGRGIESVVILCHQKEQPGFQQEVGAHWQVGYLVLLTRRRPIKQNSHNNNKYNINECYPLVP